MLLWLAVASLSLITVIFAAPSGRYSHTATLIDDKLYFLGGISANDKLLNDFVYLDLSQNVTLSNLNFQSFSLHASNPAIAWHTAVTARGSFIYYYGGVEPVNGAPALSKYTYSLDVKYSNVWTQKDVPLDVGPSPRRSLTAVVDKNANMYVFGGSNQTETGPTRGNGDTAMYRQDTRTGQWTKIPLKNTTIDPTLLPGFDYSATMLDDGNIVYIGGQLANGVYPDMNKVYTYNTVRDQWTLNPAKGTFVATRAAHSAVLAPDKKRIIVYGGYGEPEPLTEDQAIAILDVSTWTWSRPTVKNTQVRHGHSATLYKNWMIVAFGANQTTLDSPVYEDDVIAMLDITDNNMSWVSFKSTEGNTTDAGSDGPNNMGAIIGGTAAGVFGFLVIGSAIFFGMRHYRKKREKPPLYQDEMTPPVYVSPQGIVTPYV